MLKHYFINNKTNEKGNQLIHNEYCLQIPKNETSYVGMFKNCSEAIMVARENYPTVKECKRCSSNCQEDY